jgi:AbrB family looped-hinge helix DNA binding protein
MVHIVKVARHGAITIPAEIRKKYGINDGSFLGIEENKGDLRLVKLKVQKESFMQVAEEMAAMADKKGITKRDVIKASRKAGMEVHGEEFGKG